MTLSHNHPFAFRNGLPGQDTAAALQGNSADPAPDFTEYGFTDQGFTDHGGSHAHNTPNHDTASHDTHGMDSVPTVFLPTQRRWHGQLPVALAGGAAIATSLGVLYWEGSQPQFEGRVQLVPRHADAVSSAHAVSDAPMGSSSVAPPEVSAAPVFSPSAHGRFLTHTILPHVLEELQAQGHHLSVEDLAQHIQVDGDATRGFEVSYRADDAEGVHQVLGAIARAYETQTGMCQSQACQSAQYIQAQIPKMEHEVLRLRAELDAFRQQHQIENLDRQHRELEAEIHEFRRLQQTTAQELAIAQSTFAEYQHALGLSPNSNAAQVLLERSPGYGQRLRQWTALDQQMVSYALSHTEPPDDIAQAYEQLTQQLYHDRRHGANDLLLYDMPSDLRYAIIDEPQRLEAIHDWLKQAQRVQFLSQRRNHIAHEAAQFNTRVQQWRSLLDQHNRIESRMTAARQTLTTYRERYTQLQQQSQPQQVAWQPASPPDVTPLETPLTRVTQWFTRHLSDAAHAQGL